MKRLATLLLSFIFTHSLCQDHDHEQLKQLDFLLGEWDIETNSRLSLQGPWEMSKASAVVRKTLQSSLIEEDYTGSRENKPFLAKTFFAVNNANNKFQRVFIDGPHGVLLLFEGEKVRQDSVIFDKTWINAAGNEVKLRVVYAIMSPTAFNIATMRMPAGTNTWDVTSRATYKRK